MTLGATASALTLSWTDNATDETGYTVERSTSGGTWQALATLAVDAVSYGDATAAAGTEYCYRVRAFNGAGVSAWSNSACGTLNVAPSAGTQSAATLFGTAVPRTPIDSDTAAVELGVKLQSSAAGQITGIRFYRGVEARAAYTVNLWRRGVRLATATVPVQAGLAAGWREARFATPVNIVAGRTYIASYHTPNGGYAADEGALTRAITSGPLTALASGSSGGNGVYRYGAGGVMPSNSYRSSNYFVDVLFQATTATGNTTPGAPTASLTANPTALSAGSATTLSWSSSNASSCSGTNFSTGGATSGALSVTPQATTTYALTCSGSGGSASAQTTVSVSTTPTPQSGGISAKSCAQADVQAAIDAAQDGAIVRVPAGSCTWSAGDVSISDKTILLQGAGSSTSGTVITYGGAGHALLSINPGSKTGRMEISGFRFRGGDSNYWGGQHIHFSGPRGWRNLRIHHNAFVDSVNAALRGYSETHGLIDHNSFEGRTHAIQLDGGGSRDWSDAVAFGSASFMFIEDNQFHMTDTYGNTGHMAVDVTNGGGVVFRHNSLHNAFFENHDRCRSGLPSARAFEVYNNTFTKDSTGWKAIDLSSGDGVIYNNTIADSWNIALGAYQSRDGTCQLPANEELGAINPVYTWNNKRASGGNVDTIVCTSSAAGCARMTFATPGQQKPSYTPYTYPHPLAAGAQP